MSAFTSVPASVVTVKAPSSPGSVGGVSRNGLPRFTSTWNSASWRRSSAFSSDLYGPPNTSSATSSRTIDLSGHT